MAISVALIEPYLFDNSGHYYNFVKELEKGFGEVINDCQVDIYVPADCKIDSGFKKTLPSIRKLKETTLPNKVLVEFSFIFNFHRMLRKIEKCHDLLIFTTADGFRLLLLLLNINFRKTLFLYSHMFFSARKQELILRCARRRKGKTFFITPFENSEEDHLYYLLKKRGFDVIFNAPYPFHFPEKSSNSKNETYFSEKNPIISYLGPARKEKGFIEVVKFVQNCKREGVEYNFFVQCSGAYEKEVKEYIQVLKKENFQNVTIFENFLPEEKYLEVLQRSTILLLLYESFRYRSAISSVLLESLSYGKPVVVRDGSWLANQVKEYGGGIIVSDTSILSIKDAIEKILSEYVFYSNQAKVAAEKLRTKHNGRNLAKMIFELADLEKEIE